MPAREALLDQEPVLAVDDLVIEFRGQRGTVRAVDGAEFSVRAGEVLGVVGESGSGKTVSALSVLGLNPAESADIVSGSITFGEVDMLSLSDEQMREIRGGEIGFVFQDPMTALNPVLTVGSQLMEVIAEHNPGMGRRQAKERSLELLESVGIPNHSARFDQYPHELSGGMRQRVVIAGAIANDPRLLIADEPTTALDVTIQAQVMELLRDIQQRTNAAVILITHDLSLVAEVADRVSVMYGGRVVETGPVVDIFERPSHPYTLGLLESLPRPDKALEKLNAIPGTPPILRDRIEGCAFAARCSLSADRETCHRQRPDLRTVQGNQKSACHFFEEMVSVTSSASPDRG